MGGLVWGLSPMCHTILSVQGIAQPQPTELLWDFPIGTSPAGPAFPAALMCIMGLEPLPAVAIPPGCSLTVTAPAVHRHKVHEGQAELPCPTHVFLGFLPGTC